MHTSNNKQTEHMIFRNIYVHTSMYMKVRLINENGDESLEGFHGRKGNGVL